MPNEIAQQIAEFDSIPKRLLNIVTGYVFFLTLIMKKHSFRVASRLLGLHESRFCAALNNPEMAAISSKTLNRAMRRRIKRFKGRLVFIIDSTIMGRRSRHVENVRKCHTGQGFKLGHKFVNFTLLDGEGIIPLYTEAVLTKAYARKNGIKHRSEIKIVEEWIRALGSLFMGEQLKSAVFLFDSGYDAKCIQKAVQAIGAHFVMALKSSRLINGKRVKEYFRRTKRGLKSHTIRLTAGSGGKGSRRSFSIRTATKAVMKGFGSVTVVCSKAIGRKGKPLKYLVSSDVEMSGREIVKWYARRWAIEIWHREIKQNFGFGDCASRKFTAICSHVNLCLTAYLLQTASGRRQMRLEEYVQERELKKINTELSRFGSKLKVQKLVKAALHALAA